MLRPIRDDIVWRVWYVDMSVSPPRVHTFDNTMGTPADCQAYNNEFVLTVRQRSQLGQTTDRIEGWGMYAYFKVNQMWSGMSQREIDSYPAGTFSAILDGGSFPNEIFTNALEWPDTDDDFPSMAPRGAFEIADEDRFNAALSLERPVRLGRPGSIRPR